ncbi:shortage in chiasmata 1 [Tasmannia lanceolata]|uniref:shortage in chiasmata 1 n=1 Tax=Tasmannia lanceolata TaxID=3420 RepID=UPI004063A977
MRTRFLNIDFFRNASNEALENFNIVRFPVPNLPPSDLSPIETEISSFDFVLDVSLQLESFPIQNALSQFYSVVLPRIYDIENGDFPDIFSRNENTSSEEEKDEKAWRHFRSDDVEFVSRENENSCFDIENDGERQRNFRSDSPEIEIIEKEAKFLYIDKEVEKQRKFRSRTPEKDDESYHREKQNKRTKGIQFEIPEVEFPMAKSYVPCNEEHKGIHFEIPGSEIHLEMLKLKPQDAILYPHELSRTIYSVEDMTAEYHVDQRSCSYVEDSGHFQERGLPNSRKLLNFEVNEIALELYTCAPFEEEFHLLLENIGNQHCAQTDGFLVDCKELLGSTGVDILECLSGQDPPEQCLEYQSVCFNSVLEMDFTILTDNMHHKTNLITSPDKSDADSFPMETAIHFHEVDILDLTCFQPFDAFVSSQMRNEPETLEQMFREDMNCIGSVYESVVNSELALVDDTFKSLPIPVLCDDKVIILFSTTFEDILGSLKLHPPSACDGIYLDWHLLLEDTCNRDICSTYRNMWEVVDTYGTAYELQSTDGAVRIDFDLCDDTLDGLNVSHYEEIFSDLPDDISVVNELITKVTPPTQLLNDVKRKPKNGEPTPTESSKKASLFLESMSQFNDLNFFMKARKGTSGRNSEETIKEITDSTVALPGVSSTDPILICASPEVKFQQWNVELHWVTLPHHILDLIDNIHKIYLTIVENDTGLRRKCGSFQAVDDFKFLTIPKKKLLDLISNSIAAKSTSACEDETLMAYIALYVIKQMVHYLCFFGIHSAHLYLRNFFQSLKYFRVRLSLLHTLIEDAYLNAEKGVIESHPSLLIIEKILRSNSSQNGRKILIVADRIFWWPLKRKLTDMRISCHEVRNGRAYFNQPDELDNEEFSNSIADALLSSDCLLVSHGHVFSSFPFHKFGIFLEYGGSYGESRLSTTSPKLVGLPHVDFLKVELEEFSVPKALCDGFDVSHHLKFEMEDVSQPMAALEEGFNYQKLLRLLKFVPIVDKDVVSLEAADRVEACHVPESVLSMPFPMNSEDTHSRMHDIIIIVNTQNFDKEMLISRRSSYQKILAMEKGGVQVVERELDLPVDLIFNAAICLVWYDAKNIGVNATAKDRAYSSIADCMENIATNILMSLSFAFSSCVLVFEGESNFLAAIMESSDGLYAAAASLDIHLQLFCSYSPELTDEIILSCIKYATTLHRGLYPAMLESETLGESFLTKFPSINPLSAHAIMSSGGMLVEFLEWSCEQRIRAIGKYHVPDESIALFSALCRYGELGESKSGMTECSSLSSSDYSSGKIQKQQKYSMGTHTLEILTDRSLDFEPLKRPKDCGPNPSEASCSYQSRIFSSGHKILEKRKNQTFSLKDELLCQKHGVDAFVMNDLNWNDISISENVNEDFEGEVIDHDISFLNDDFPSIANTKCFSSGVPQIGKGVAAGNSEFGTEFHYDSDICLSMKDNNRHFEDIICGKPDIKSNIEVFPMKRRGEFLEDSKIHKSMRNDLGLSFQEKVRPSNGETPLSNAICSSQLSQGSPWTIEFFNRIKEKTRMNQKSPLCNSSSNCSGGFRNIDKCVKRKSPSALDGYRYKGGGHPRKTIQPKWQKRLRQPLDSINIEKKDLSITPTWTPIDKRARQTLSFARNGNEKQSKLVWGDRNISSWRKRC